MKPFLKYNLYRAGLLVISLGLVWFLPLNLLVRLMLALVISGIASLFLLRNAREEISTHIAARVDRGKAERDKLRAALAGEDDQPTPAA